MADEEADRPILAGLLALVAVGLVVGLLISLLTLAGTSVLGLGGSSSSGGTASGERSMYLPTPKPTEKPSGPLVTLAPGEAQSAEPTSQPKRQKKQQRRISLSASQTEVGSMGRIDLTGTYPGGEGAIVQVQRFEAGRWVDFPVDASVSGGTFATYVTTGRTGENRFRVVDSDTGQSSNAVTVTVR